MKYKVAALAILTGMLNGSSVSTADDTIAELIKEQAVVETREIPSVSQSTPFVAEPTPLAIEPIQETPLASPPRVRRHYHNHTRDVTRMYLQTEATFLSRRYDRAEANFNLLNMQFEPTVDYHNEFVGADPRLIGLSWNTTPALLTSTLGSGDETEDDLIGSNRITLGVVAPCGIGIQGRYWQTEDSLATHGPFATVNTADPDAWRIGALSINSDFEQFRAQTADLELTYDLDLWNWSGVATMGVRYADLNNVRHTTADGGLRTGMPGILVSGDNLRPTFHTADYDFQSLQSIDFTGTGPTFSLSGILPVTKYLSIFSSARTSVLIGESRSHAMVAGQMSSLFDASSAIASNEAFSTDPLFMNELQLGLQWSAPTKFMNARFFARAAFEYQFWRHAASQSQASISPNNLGDFGDTHTILFPLNTAGGNRGQIDSGRGTTQGSASATGLDSDFDLIGFTATAGFVW